jgi:hypothetical protein
MMLFPTASSVNVVDRLQTMRWKQSFTAGKIFESDPGKLPLTWGRETVYMSDLVDIPSGPDI